MDNNIKNEIINLLECLKKDAEMGLRGCFRTEDGFESQIYLINNVLNKLKDEKN